MKESISEWYTLTRKKVVHFNPQDDRTSANAVKAQIWTALIAILLIKFLQFKSRMKWALSNLVALLRWNLFTQKDLWKWIDDPFIRPNPPPEGELKQPFLDGISA